MVNMEVNVPKTVAVGACVFLTLFYVAILYAPTLILRLPPPPSLKVFFLRRFLCAAISSVFSLVFSAFILRVTSEQASSIFGVYGVRSDHMWQAVVFPLSLTALMYAGSFFYKFQSLFMSFNKDGLSHVVMSALQESLAYITSMASNILAWRSFIVAPVTEELVFRACMIPLLLCGGFKTSTVIFLCPIFFSLAHLNHLMEIYSRENFSLLKASMVVGLQLGYTVVFGWYASFLFVRTGNILPPLVAHMFCNLMGLPVMIGQRRGLVTVAFVAGMVAFLWLLFPMTQPDLYNYKTNNCRCWHGYCSWN